MHGTSSKAFEGRRYRREQLDNDIMLQSAWPTKCLAVQDAGGRAEYNILDSGTRGQCNKT